MGGRRELAADLLQRRLLSLQLLAGVETFAGAVRAERAGVVAHRHVHRLGRRTHVARPVALLATALGRAVNAVLAEHQHAHRVVHRLSHRTIPRVAAAGRLGQIGGLAPFQRFGQPADLLMRRGRREDQRTHLKQPPADRRRKSVEGSAHLIEKLSIRFCPYSVLNVITRANSPLKCG